MFQQILSDIPIFIIEYEEFKKIIILSSVAEKITFQMEKKIPNRVN